MQPEELRSLLESLGAIREGHFELSSGRHSSTYVQCALVLQHPQYAEQLGRALAAMFADSPVGAVVSPALGGVILGHEAARALGVRAMFVERDSSGHLTLRRGFDITPDEHILVVEDVWTTGGSTAETIAVVQQAGGRVVAAGALIDRSGGRLELPVPARSLLDLRMESFLPHECPHCQAGRLAEKPGSRALHVASYHY